VSQDPVLTRGGLQPEPDPPPALPDLLRDEAGRYDAGLRGQREQVPGDGGLAAARATLEKDSQALFAGSAG
jgi:hypothetical protein